jgi:hypothetical protein
MPEVCPLLILRSCPVRGNFSCLVRLKLSVSGPSCR